MKLTARTVTQNGEVFYETAIPAIELIDDELFRPDRWNPISNEGYQRELSQEHARRIQSYLKGDGGTSVLPTNIIINSRMPLRITKIGDGLVEIDVKEFPLYIIDGQHRVTALRQAEENGTTDLSNYELGVTLTQFSLRDEMIHFRNINGRSNRPPKALSDLLMGTLAERYGLVPSSMEEQGLIRANRVVMRLATDAEAPWYNLIALGGTRRRAFHATVQSSLASSILPMFTNGRFSDPEEDTGKIYRIFRDWWMALAEVWPESFEDPNQTMFIRGGGFYAWHRVLSRVLTNANFEPTKMQMIAALSELRDVTGWDEEFWKFTNYNGARAFTANFKGNNRGGGLAEVIWRELPKEALREKKEVANG